MPSSLLTLLDDIATGLDDVALLTKVAAQKTAGVLGDDLALNAQQVAGVSADRELPVVWAVAKGSAMNKAILVPAALVISAVAVRAVTPLLMIGGAFLCYEGVEKLAHKLFQGTAHDDAHEDQLRRALADPAIDLKAFEKDTIRGAVRTDFILSAEIIVIALGTVASATFATQVLVLTSIAVTMTIGVYGLVAAIVKLDSESGAPLRGDDGLCVACARGEAGEAIGRIGTADEGGGRFEGYTDARETEKKILHDVLAKGDAWFRTGDLMRLDEQGFFHFVDRVGDTFRWKGENVATSEVNDAIRECAGVLDATTYGVEIAGHDGRAGMSAIVVASDFDFSAFADHLARRLPAYAHPVFVRISQNLDATETFKQKKHQLAREGFDPAGVTDPLYFRDPALGEYRPLLADEHARIIGGTIRV